MEGLVRKWAKDSVWLDQATMTLPIVLYVTVNVKSPLYTIADHPEGDGAREQRAE